jgi:N-carbamoyl-L-amino-acid hydrolase
MKRREFVQSASAAGVMATAGGAGLAARQGRSALRINGTRINRHLAELAEFGKNPQGGVSRVAYSEADRQGRAYTMNLMKAARLDVSVDTAGNIWGRRAGSQPGLKPIIFGSHIDSVPEGGNYDGDVGSLGAIEVAQTLAEAGLVSRHPLEVVVWQNEEGGLWGSHAATGVLTAQELAQVAVSGKTIRDGIAFLGGDPARLDASRRAQGSAAGYLELHIEQGGTLEQERIQIGIVEGIVAIRQWIVTVEGLANHAGTTAMADRHDALLSASRFVQAVNRIVTGEPGRQVGTVGRIQAFPGAPNVIPGRVECSLELRDLDVDKINRLIRAIREEADRIGQMNGTTFSFRTNSTEHKPALSHPAMRAHVAAAARLLGLTTRVMPSGAGHDAQNLARICPMAMIFIPSIGGISHSPKEYSTPGDIENGVNVLLHAVLAADAAGGEG